MKRLLLIPLLFSFALPATAQDKTRVEMDSLLALLKKSKQGDQRMNSLLQLAQFHILKPGENKADFDSADNLLNEAARLNEKAGSDEIAGGLLLTRSMMEKEKGQRELARTLLDKAIPHLEKGAAHYFLGKAYQELAGFYDHNNTEERPIKISMLEKAAKAYGLSNKKEDQAFCMVSIGELNHLFGRQDEAVSILKAALAIYDSIGYPLLQSVYDVLGNIYLMQNNYYLALKYELRALQAAEQTGDSSMMLCRIYLTLGSVQSQLSHHEEALSYMKSSLKIALRHRDKSAISMILLSTGRTLNTLNRQQEMLELLATISPELLRPDDIIQRSYMTVVYADSYNGTGQFKKADRYSDTLWMLASDPGMPLLHKISIYRTLSWFYLRRKNFGAMRKCLEINTALTNEFGNAKLISFNYMGLYRLDSATGNFRSAFFNLLAFKTIDDSLFNQIKSSQIQQLVVEYETAKKKDSIKLKDMDIMALTKTNKLQTENLRQARLLRNITIAGIALALIFTGVYYRQYRNKQQSNQLISEQNRKLQHLVSEKEWLLKEVHHRVKNNLQTVVSLLELQSEYLSNEALAAVQESQNRIYATSLLHQRLYQEENAAAVDISIYVPELVRHLKEAYNTRTSIDFKLKVSQLQLDISQAVPVGLILNELITNSIKYAFNDPVRQPEIAVNFTLLPDGFAELVVADNGIGLPDDPERKFTSLGLKLVKGLAEDIEGEAIFENREGARACIRFKPRLSLVYSPQNTEENKKIA